MKPSRVLHSIVLYNEKQIYPGVFYACDMEGRGRIHNQQVYLGIAQFSYLSGSDDFYVRVFEQLCPAGEFIRRGYGNQQAANQALRDHSLRLILDRLAHSYTAVDTTPCAQELPIDQLYHYLVPVQWSMSAEVPIVARSFDLAMDAARNLSLPNGKYVRGSFEVLPQGVRETPLIDQQGQSIKIGSHVCTPDAGPEDLHMHSFSGLVTDVHYACVTVLDSEGNAFDFEPERLRVITPAVA